jgi:putative sigma-54 modulation protein
MNWKHTFKHVDVSDSLKNYAEVEFEKVGRFLLKESQFQIFYSKGKQHQFTVDATVQNGTGYFKASAKAETLYLAVDICADKLGKQFQKRKEKLQHHKNYVKSKEAKIDRLSPELVYVDSVVPHKKPA